MKRFLNGFSLIVLGQVLAVNAHGMGKATPGGSCPAPNPGSPTALTLPNPTRKVWIQPSAKVSFRLPNHQLSDGMEIYADGLFRSAIGEASKQFKWLDGNPENEAFCGRSLRLQSEVTAIEFNTTFSGSFGYVGGSDVSDPGAAPQINVPVQVTGGQMKMGFGFKQCKDGTCATLASSTSSNILVGASIGFEFSMGQFTGGAEFAANPAVSDILSKLMKDGLNKLSRADLSGDEWWHATVREIDAATGTLYFDAGSVQNIGPNQLFSVYSALGVCEAYREIARIHSVDVSPLGTQARIDRVFGEVKVGDIVRIGALPR